MIEKLKWLVIATVKLNQPSLNELTVEDQISSLPAEEMVPFSQVRNTNSIFICINKFLYVTQCEGGG